jgi:hypothetical protein
MAAAAAILLLLGGVAAGVVTNGDSNDAGSDDQADTEQGNGGTDGGGGPGTGPGGGPGGSGTVLLVVRPIGPGQGAITSRPAGIRCRPQCRLERPRDSDILLTATADEASVFAGWRGGGCSGRGTCRLGLGDDTTVTAAFEETAGVTHAVTVEPPQGGTVTSNPSGITCPSACDADFPNGAQVTLTAAVQTGFEFISWLGDCSGNAACVLSMNEDKQVDTTFGEVHTLTVEMLRNTPNDSVESRPPGIACRAPSTSCKATFSTGTSVLLIANDELARLSGASAGSGSCAGTSSTCTVNLRRDEVVTANFQGPG